MKVVEVAELNIDLWFEGDLKLVSLELFFITTNKY